MIHKNSYATEIESNQVQGQVILRRNLKTR